MKTPFDYLYEALVARGRQWGDQNEERLKKENLYPKTPPLPGGPAFKYWGHWALGTKGLRRTTSPLSGH